MSKNNDWDRAELTHRHSSEVDDSNVVTIRCKKCGEKLATYSYVVGNGWSEYWRAIDKIKLRTCPKDQPY